MGINRYKMLKNVGEVEYVELKNKNDMRVTLSSYGAAITKIYVANKDQREILVTMQSTDLNDFNVSKQNYGKTIGRYSGRILTKPFHLNNETYQATPHGALDSQLHGGKSGFGQRHFELVELKSFDYMKSVTFKLISKHLEEGFPGDLNVFITYTLDDLNKLTVDFNAKSSLDTICNLTNHVYFNLSGNVENIDNHMLTVNAKERVEIDANYVPKRLVSTMHTDYDFTKERLLKDAFVGLDKNDFNGLDHTFILDNPNLEQSSVSLKHMGSKLGLNIYTTYPAVVLYTHNHLCDDVKDITLNHGFHSSIAIECQFEPGGIHFPFLNDAILRKDDTYQHKIVYEFIDLL
jgi:aldose 1-epimerase